LDTQSFIAFAAEFPLANSPAHCQPRLPLGPHAGRAGKKKRA
jgi:hypothetical protein